jgi:glycosyltransferase involved in cell wall biosynthesis
MKICVFSRSIPVHSFGGMEKHCWSVSVGFSKKGHIVKLITTSHPQGKEYEKINSNFEVFYLKDTKPGKYSKKWWKKSLQKFLELDRVEKFDVVFSESSGALAVLKYKVKNELLIPVVFRLPGTALRDAITQIKQKISIRSVLAAIKNFILFFRDKKWFKYADAIITCSDEIANVIKKEMKIEESKIYTIYNGVNLERFYPKDKNELRRTYKISKDKFIILTVSRLKKIKGIDVFIYALNSVLKKFKNIELFIIGDGDYRKNLERLVHKLDLQDYVKFLGNVPNDNLPNYYNLSDIFVLPTRAKEGFPWVIIEAMACKKPVIVSNIGGVSGSIIKDGENGLLFEPSNIKDLEEKILLLLNNPQFRDKIAENGYQTVKRFFSEEIMINKTLEVIEKHAKLS